MRKKKNNFIALVIGRSGSGKTTVTEAMHRMFGYRPLSSYTTRPPRSNHETGHVFIADEEFDKIPKEEMVAYTEFCGYRYCATNEQVENAELYVIDPAGVQTFLRNYHGNKSVIIFFLDVSEDLARKRMQARGDDEATIEKRIQHDREIFAESYGTEIHIGERDSVEKIARLCEWSIQGMQSYPRYL